LRTGASEEVFEALHGLRKGFSARCPAGGRTSEYVGKVLLEGLADELGVPEDQRRFGG